MSPDETAPLPSGRPSGPRERFEGQEDEDREVTRLRATSQVRTWELSLLAEIVASFDPSHRREAMLASLLRYATKVSGATQCLVLLWEEHEARFSVCTTSPGACGDLILLEPLQLERQQLHMLRNLSGREQFSALGAYVHEYANPLNDSGYAQVYAVPFLLEGRLLGLLYCYYDATYEPSIEEDILLRTLANLAARTLGYYRLLDLLTHGPLVKGIFDFLVGHSEESEDTLQLYASMLALNLERPHCLALVEIEGSTPEKPGRSDKLPEAGIHLQSGVERVAELLRARLRDEFPGSWFYQQNHTIIGLIELATEASALYLKNWLLDQHRELSRDRQVRLFIGLSHPYRAIRDYRHGFVEAGQALTIGRRINPEGGVIHISDVRINNSLTALSVPGESSDPYQEKINQLAHYDQRSGKQSARLLQTLEAYLTAECNAARTATLLEVHRNTVDQRLHRIKKLTGIAVPRKKDPALRNELQRALRLYKLQSQ